MVNFRISFDQVLNDETPSEVQPKHESDAENDVEARNAEEAIGVLREKLIGTDYYDERTSETYTITDIVVHEVRKLN